MEHLSREDMANRTSWQRRAHGFMRYFTCAFIALFCPRVVDLALRDALNDEYDPLD